MRKLIYAMAITAVGSFADPSSAAPITGRVSGGIVPILDSDGLVQKVHDWHCRKRYGLYRGRKYRHRHWPACDEYYGGYPGPFFGFYWGDHRHHDFDRSKNRRRKKDGGDRD